MVCLGSTRWICTKHSVQIGCKQQRDTLSGPPKFWVSVVGCVPKNRWGTRSYLGLPPRPRAYRTVPCAAQRSSRARRRRRTPVWRCRRPDRRQIRRRRAYQQECVAWARPAAPQHCAWAYVAARHSGRRPHAACVPVSARRSGQHRATLAGPSYRTAGSWSSTPPALTHAQPITCQGPLRKKTAQPRSDRHGRPWCAPGGLEGVGQGTATGHCRAGLCDRARARFCARACHRRGDRCVCAVGLAGRPLGRLARVRCGAYLGAGAAQGRRGRHALPPGGCAQQCRAAEPRCDGAAALGRGV